MFIKGETGVVFSDAGTKRQVVRQMCH